MAVLEAVAGLAFVVFIVAVLIVIAIIVPEQLASRRKKRSLGGRIEQKQQELAEQDNYLKQLTSDITGLETADYRKEMLATYRELALKKRKQLALELEVLKAERDTEEFEKRMQRRER